MHNRKNLYNKKGFVTMRLARELLNYKEGDRINTVDSYAKNFSSSRGVVQQSFQVLEQEQAIARETRGTLGTFIHKMDYRKLWELAGWDTLTGVSPLPYTKQHEGMATGIYCVMEDKNIPFHFAYMQGAKNRAKGVADNAYHFAIMSKNSALEVIKDNKNISILTEFDPYTFLSGYITLFKDESYKNKDYIRVGIDPNSPDHVKLIKEIFKDKNVEYSNIQYTRMISEILNDKIDVTIFNMDTLQNPLILSNLKFEKVKMSKEYQDGTRAVILVNNKEFGITNLLKEIIHKERITTIVNEVIQDLRIPIY